MSKSQERRLKVQRSKDLKFYHRAHSLRFRKGKLHQLWQSDIVGEEDVWVEVEGQDEA